MNFNFRFFNSLTDLGGDLFGEGAAAKTTINYDYKDSTEPGSVRNCIENGNEYCEKDDDCCTGWACATKLDHFANRCFVLYSSRENEWCADDRQCQEGQYCKITGARDISTNITFNMEVYCAPFQRIMLDIDALRNGTYGSNITIVNFKNDSSFIGI